MKVTILPLLCLFLVATSGNGQSRSHPYDWDYIMKYVRKHKMNTTEATHEILDEIVRQHEGALQQAELIRFYRDAYNYKIVDKGLLKKVIDSLVIHGSADSIRVMAINAIQSTEFKILGKKIRDFAFEDKDGLAVHLSEFRDKIVILELWATWCAPCIEEMRKIPAIRTRNPNVEFYSISLDSKPEKMARFVNKNKYDWPIVFGGDQEVNPELWDYLNIVAIPKYYIIDRNGVVIQVADKLDEEAIENLK